MRSIFVLIAGLLAAMHAMGQQAFNPVTYGSWVSTPTNQFAVIPAAPGATFSQFSRGSGNQFSTAADGFNSGKWNNATPVEAIGVQRFVTFSVMADAVSTVNIDSLKFVFGRNTSGPDSCIVQYKGPSNGYNFTAMVTNGFQIFAPAVSPTTSISVVPAAALTITPGDSIIFRVVAWGATGTLGTLKIMNGTQVFGSVSVIPSNSIAAPSVLTVDPFCTTTVSSDSISVSYTSSGVFNAGNVYSLELSDNAGSFTSPVLIGTLNDISNTGEIEGLIPAGTIAGNYRLRISSSNPASSGDTTEISIHPGFSISAVLMQPLCASETGSIDLSLSGGTAPFSYAWSNTEVSQDLQNLESGQYAVSVADAAGCMADSLFTIDEIDAVEIAETVSGLTCNNSADGMIELAVSGGTAPYTYSWTNSAEITPELDSLAAGTYEVTVADNNGCTISADFTVNEPTALAVTENIVHATCATCQGTITLNVTGGTAPYSYDWDGTPATNALAGIPGEYCVEITDNNGCQLEDCYQILSTAGLDEAGSTSTAVTVFPNPTAGAGFVSFKSNAFAGKGKVEITDVHGKLVGDFIAGNQETFLSLDVSSWEDGVYFFRFTPGDRLLTETGRFVLSH